MINMINSDKLKYRRVRLKIARPIINTHTNILLRVTQKAAERQLC